MYNENQDHIDKLAHLYNVELINENDNPIPQSFDDRHADDI